MYFMSIKVEYVNAVIYSNRGTNENGDINNGIAELSVRKGGAG